jgi:hypothetical protein
MFRLTLVLAVWMSLVAVASASLTPRKEALPFGPAAPSTSASKLLAPAAQPAARHEANANADYILTDQTEVLLNDKPCKYAEVPAHARIVQMEVAADNKTVLKVHFRTGK